MRPLRSLFLFLTLASTAAFGAELKRDLEYGQVGETHLLLDASVPRATALSLSRF